jgi:hypothetical protein
MAEQKYQSLRSGGRSVSNSLRNPFLILITILLAVSLIFVVFSAAFNETVLNPGFINAEFEKYQSSGGYGESGDLRELIGQLTGVSGLFYFVFYVLVILSVILSLFIVLISYRDLVRAFVYLASAAVFASVLSYILSVLAFKLTLNRIQGDGGVLSEQVTIDILSGFTWQVRDYAIILLFMGLLLLVLAYLTKRMIRFLETAQDDPGSKNDN